MSSKLTLSRCLDFLTSREIHVNRTAVIFFTMILTIWLSVVIFTETRHEFWRDEVRAFSLAREASSPLDLYQLIKYEGHPFLWYLLLFIGKSIVNTPVVLPITSIAIGSAGVMVFMFMAPFPIWFKCVFIFSALPLYEYSVMARNYGISMLLMFIAAALYPKRNIHPYLLAFSLALLANTNIHSAVLAALIATVWFSDVFSNRSQDYVRTQSVSLLFALLIFMGGLALCAIYVAPSRDTIATTVARSFSVKKLADSAFIALIRPDVSFRLIFPASLPNWAAIILLLLAGLGLVRRPELLLAALGASVALGTLFRMVSPGYYRHQGLYLIFLLTLYWLLSEDTEIGWHNRMTYSLHRIGFFFAVGVLVAVSTALSMPTIRTDLTMAESSNKALGELLNQSSIYRNAIIVPEPDYRVESLPYYAENLIYFPREQLFGTTVSFTSRADSQLWLGDLLNITRNLHTRYKRPVLIVLGHFDLDPTRDGAIQYSFNKVFYWTAADLKDFYQSTTLVARFDKAVSDENYLVFELNDR